MPLVPTPVAVPIGRLDQSKPKDNGVTGDLVVAENLYVASGNNVTGGLELSKREGCQAMPRTVYGVSGALAFLFGVTCSNSFQPQFYPINGTGAGVLTSPGFVPPAGNATSLTVVVSANGFDAEGTFEIYKNGVATGHFVTPGAGATGTFAASSFSVSFNGTSDVLDLVLIGTHETPIEFSTQFITFQATVAFTAVAPADISDGLRLGTLDNALVLRARNTIYSWLPHANAWKDHGGGLRPAISVDSRQTTGVRNLSMAVGGGLEMIVSTGGSYSVRDVASGTMVVERITLPGASFGSKIVYSDGRFCIFYRKTDLHMHVATILPTTPSVWSDFDLGALSALGTTSARFDVQATPENLVAYAFVDTGSGATSFTKGFFDPSAGTTSNVGSVDLGTSKAVVGLAWLTQTPWTSSPRQYWLAAVVDGGVGFRNIYSIVFSATLGSPVATLRHSYTGAWPGQDDLTKSASVAGYHDASATGGAVIFFDKLGTLAIDNRIDLPGGTALARSLKLASQAFSHSGRWYVLAFFDSILQPSFFLLDVTTGVGRVVAKARPGDAAQINETFLLPAVITVGETFAIPVGHVTGETVTDFLGTTFNLTAAGVCTFNFIGSDLSQPRQLSNGNLHFPGALPLEFDGTDVLESGFLVFPEAPTVVSDPTAGFVAVGVHSVRVVYSRLDARGNLHRSAPSVPVQVTITTPSQKIAITVPTLRVTMSRSVSVEAYATTATDPDIYYLIGAFVVANPYDPSNPNGATDTVTISMVESDLALSSNEQLYTGAPAQPGELEHISPPPCRIVARHKNRLFYAGVDTDPGAVWISNESVPGFGASFSDALVFRVDGAVTALASAGNYLEIFTADRIWIASGEFPDATGGGPAIPIPFRLDHDVGALSSGSVVVASTGTYFKSKKGIWTLDGGLGITPVSDPIGDLRQGVGDVSSVEITAGLVTPARAHVRFYTNDAKTYVWDSEWKAWTFSIGAAMSAVDAINWNGLPTHLQADGTVRQEGPGTYFDTASVFLPSRLRLAVANLAGIRGYAELIEIQVVGRLRFPVTVTARLYLDGSETPENPFTFTLGGGVDPVLFAIRPKKRKCSSVAIEIIDSVTSGVSPGMTIEALTILAGVHPRLGRLPASKRTARGA